MHSLFQTSSRSAVVQECEQMMGLAAPFDRRDVLRAYRETAKSAHPDGGGSDEAMIKLTVCRETLLCVADPSHCKRSSPS